MFSVPGWFIFTSKIDTANNEDKIDVGTVKHAANKPGQS